jgi:hypothetical protein
MWGGLDLGWNGCPDHESGASDRRLVLARARSRETSPKTGHHLPFRWHRLAFKKHENMREASDRLGVWITATPAFSESATASSTGAAIES